jgi:hypothetical protein
MKRLGALLFYAVGALATLYLALYLYAMLTASKLVPGDPIRIFRRPDAPDYSVLCSLDRARPPSNAATQPSITAGCPPTNVSISF